jgi:hypothetical protein
MRALDNKFSLLKAQKIYYKAQTNFRICYKALKKTSKHSLLLLSALANISWVIRHTSVVINAPRSGHGFLQTPIGKRSQGMITLASLLLCIFLKHKKEDK